MVYRSLYFYLECTMGSVRLRERNDKFLGQRIQFVKGMENVIIITGIWFKSKWIERFLRNSNLRTLVFRWSRRVVVTIIDSGLRLCEISKSNVCTRSGLDWTTFSYPLFDEHILSSSSRKTQGKVTPLLLYWLIGSVSPLFLID